MSESTIHSFAKWQVKPAQLTEVIELLKKVVGESVKEEGNLFYQVNQSNTDPNLIIYEGYKDEAALQKHRESPYFQNIVVGQIVPMLENREVILARQLLFDTL
jgi:autoinducer 2-degrading protein